MKKITILFTLLISYFGISQTVLFNYDTINPDFEFCFDAPDPDQCTTTRETNDDTSGVNTSNMFLQSIAPTVGGPFQYGIGIEFDGPFDPQPTINSTGEILSIAFRSDNNPTGNLAITAQLWANDNDRIDGFSSYTKTDGSWEIIFFDYTGSTPAGAFDNDTGIVRANFFISEGAANGFTYGIDEVTLNTAASLSTDTIAENTEVVFSPNPVIDQINISTTGDIVIFDILGNKVYEGISDTTNIDVSALASGVYFLVAEGKKTTKFIKQ